MFFFSNTTQPLCDQISVQGRLAASWAVCVVHVAGLQVTLFVSGTAIYYQAAIDWVLLTLSCKFKKNHGQQLQVIHTHTHIYTYPLRANKPARARLLTRTDARYEAAENCLSFLCWLYILHHSVSDCQIRGIYTNQRCIHFFLLLHL